MAKNLYFLFLVCGLFLRVHSANALAQPAPALTAIERAAVLRTKLVALASSQVGVKEAGYNDGPQVRQYLASCGLPPGQFWCGAFINWCCKALGIRGPNGPGAARNWFPASKVIYRRGNRPRQVPQPGDFTAYYYRNLGRIGHIGMITRWDEAAGTVATIEGNYGGGSERNGDGVYRVRRLVGQVYEVSDWITQPTP